ncbi:MAG: serine/threonine-protein kinase, partial [Propionibacteriaceae bacterium]
MSAPDDLIAGRYRPVRRVGSGAMGVVWEAWDDRLHRAVAVKQLHAQLGLSDADTELATLRAMREARITARLDHPNAVPVFDVVEHEGRPCLIMQFLPSEPLSAVLKRRTTLPAVEAARIGGQVASALAAAHQVGIVHRDVKPGNILIAQDQTARISDFGISHALGDATLTSTGLVHGTPAFMAPEIARGGEPTAAADVFGLGATLYAMLEGAPPFGTDPNSIALLHRVAAGQFEAPRDGGAVTPLLLQMLAVDPDDRPTMAEVAQYLVAVGAPGADATPTVALPPTSAARPTKPSTGSVSRPWAAVPAATP